MTARLGPLVFLLGLLARCGGGAQALAPPLPVVHVQLHRPARHVSLRSGESRRFRPGALRPGDVVACELDGHRLHIRVPLRPSGSWSVGTSVATPTTGTGAFQFELSSTSDGSVTASCR